MKITLDTNVLIYFFEGIEPQASKVEKILAGIMKGKDAGVISTALNQEANVVYSQDKDLQRFNKDIKISEL